MQKKLLVINSQTKISSLTIFFDALIDKNYFLHLITIDAKQLMLQSEKNFTINKAPSISNFLTSLFLLIALLLLPISLPLLLLIFLFLKFKNKIEAIVCFGYLEKILIAPFAKIFKIQNIWLENPDTDYSRIKKNKFLFFVFKASSRLAKIIALNDFSKHQLMLNGIKEENVYIIPPGIKLNLYQNQENIFSQIAETEQKNKNKKFYTIGTAVNLKSRQKIENLFQAAKKCLSVIPNLQLIIIGEGEERKNLSWMAKRMEIDTMVWFLGEQKSLKKWLASFDIFVSTCNTLSLEDINITLQAMTSGLPILGQKNIGLEDLIKDNLNGFLVNMDNNEELAQFIIKLRQNKNLSKQLKQNGRNIVETNFSVQSMADGFIKVMNDRKNKND